MTMQADSYMNISVTPVIDGKRGTREGRGAEIPADASENEAWIEEQAEWLRAKLREMLEVEES